MKQTMKAVVMCFLFVLILSVMKEKTIYAEDSFSVKTAESGDVNNVKGKGEVDVNGEMQKASSDPKEDPTTTSVSSTPATSVGGKVVDTTGKNVKTGDVLTSAKALAVFFVGVGCVFLILRKKNDHA